MSEECRPCPQTAPAESVCCATSRISWLTEAQRPSRISLPSTLGVRSWASLLDHTYEPFDADEVFSDLGSFKRDLHMGPDLRRLRSFSAEEAAEVAAATRFRLELERREELSEYGDDRPEPLATRPVLPRRSTSLPDKAGAPEYAQDSLPRRPSRQLRRNKTLEPIVVSGIDKTAGETQSAPLLNSRRESPLGSGEEQALAKSHRRHITISEGRGASRNILLLQSPAGIYSECTPPLPVLSPTFSMNTPRLHDLDMPPTPLSFNAPNEDQIRRGIEIFTLQDDADSLAGYQYREQPPSNFQLHSDDEEDDYQDFRSGPSAKAAKEDDQTSFVSVTPSMKRRKSIFSVFQGKSELDKLLDLYLSDDAHEVEQVPKRKQTLARRMTMSRKKKAPEVPGVPPLPQTSPPEGFRPG